MTVDAFRRVALVACCSAYLVGLAVVWRQLGWPAAVVAFVGGVLLAAVVTIETTAGAEAADAVEVDGRRVTADQLAGWLHHRRRDTATFVDVDGG